MPKNWRSIPHNVNDVTMTQHKPTRMMMKKEEVESRMVPGPLHVRDRRCCTMVRRSFTGDEIAIIAEMINDKSNRIQKYHNVLSGFDLTHSKEKMDTRSFYTIYFFQKDECFYIDTGNGNFPYVLCFFNNYLNEKLAEMLANE